MNQNKETLITVLSLVITIGILGGGYWWFTRQSNPNPDSLVSSPPANNQPLSSNTSLPSPPSPSAVTAFSPPATVPQGTTVKIDGSTSLVLVNQALKNGFEQKFAGVQVLTNAQGSSNGLKALLQGTIDIAATSRPLTAEEQEKGLVAIPVTKDAIALVVGVDNSFRKSLTSMQVKGIFQGAIQNWSEVGGTSEGIRVINRPSVSGTRKIFKELALNSEDFGNTPNIMTMNRDATTPMLQKLGTNGIGYATYTQVADQQTVRTVPIDGLTPEAANYPYRRTLYYAYKNPPSETVKAFLGYVTSPVGQQIIQDAQ
ncbi:phosphate ABC transporter substrate-binding protein [Crocosphaera sp.]|uniref:phosphate ABC transporter substrate-binding protein n=1 Tax=Crocosphaera sp. TaxID=2729996 RepID=UPI003F28A532|nr:phosphate ABC transporter substrate-binding protein [Crocosphaera sp.]